ncbi:MAG: hypothetical protein K0S76_2199 [Herbinix sp.]|jgi:hypothetical protein|nr:hypothetical protein [Herbinix sp.]
MVLNGFKVRNIFDFADYFNLAEVWQKKEDFLLFLETLVNDEVALEDVRLADHLDGKKEADDIGREDISSTNHMSRISLLMDFKKEGLEKIFQKFFVQKVTKDEGFPLYFNIRDTLLPIENIKEARDKALLALIYLMQNNEIDEAEASKIKALFPNMLIPDVLQTKTQIAFDDYAQRIDLKLFVSSRNMKSYIKEIKNGTSAVKTINIIHQGEIISSYELKAGQSMYCVMMGGEFVRKLKTISMGRTYGAYLDDATGTVHNIPLKNYRGCVYQYPDMIAFAADSDKGILGLALPAGDDGGSNVMAAVDIQNIPRNCYVVATAIYGSQYLMVREDGTAITNVYGAEEFEHLIDGEVCLNTVIGITSERTLLSTTPYNVTNKPIMSVSACNNGIAVLTLDGNVYRNDITAPVCKEVKEIGLCQNGLFVLKTDGDVYQVLKEGEQRLEGISRSIIEISVSDTGIMYRTKDDRIEIYYFDTKQLYKVRGR